MQERHDNNEIEPHNHNEYPLLYKEAKISLPSFGRFLECRKCYILLVTCALMICLICIPSSLGPAAFRHTYQANPSHPCYKYYMYYHFAFLLVYSSIKYNLMRIKYVIALQWTTDSEPFMVVFDGSIFFTGSDFNGVELSSMLEAWPVDTM